jgi:ATP-dependent 26S proteasome regulatory subunit
MSHPERLFTERLAAVGEGAPSLDEKCHMLEMLRSIPETSQRLDRMLIGDRDRLRIGLQEAQSNLQKMKELLDKMTDPPWHIGIYLCRVRNDDAEAGGENRVMVYHAGSRRVVSLADDLDADSMTLGDEVFLSNEMAFVIGKAPICMPRVGETAVFDRSTADGRLVLKWRDDETVVDAASALQVVKLESGDRVRWDRTACIAYEKIERAAGHNYFIGEIPKGRLDQVGGQRHNLDALLAALQTRLQEPETAALYLLDGKHAPLMVGPPGCGKTLMARIVCAEIARTSGRQCRFAVVKPAEWLDPYVGVTEQNIRQTFRGLGEAAKEFGMAVLFLDEIEAIGRIRGSAVGHHSDRFLDALLAEIDGFEGRGDVAIMAATNRKDLCDPGLLDRFSVEIPVNRPDMRGAREIFAIHLPPSMPFSPNGEVAQNTRSEIIDRAVSGLYSPNAENQLSVIKFRDGKARTVTAGELMSGRTIDQICRAARQAAFLRDVRSKDRGVRVEDIDEAVSKAIDRLATALTPRNAHAYLSDLPQDVDVVAVDPIRRRADRIHRYINVS